MLRGRLMGKNLGDRIRLNFIQRGDRDENWNVPVKIYRRDAPEIPFCNDMAGMEFDKWYEYVDNQSHLDPGVQLIFEGTLPLVHSFNEYIDEDVEIGRKYIYWVEADAYDEHTVLGPLAMKVRSRDVWWPYEKWVAKMHLIKQKYGDFVELNYYGHTTMRRPMPGMIVGNRRLLLAALGSVHASETGPELLLKMIDYLLMNRRDLLKRVGIAIMPAVCIDVREETVNGNPYYQRLNHNGVDLNRNFDFNWREEYVYGMSNEVFGSSTYHGPHPDSESEAEAVKNFLEDAHPIATYVYDNGSVITEDKMYYDCIPENTKLFDYTTGLCYLYSKTFRADHPGCGTFTAEPISFPFDEAVFQDTGMPAGTLEGWAYQRFRIPSFSMQYAGSEEGRASLNDDTDLDLLEKWSLRHAHALAAVMEEMYEHPFISSE